MLHVTTFVKILVLVLINHAVAQEHRIYVTIFTQNHDIYNDQMHLFIASSRPVPVHVDVHVPFFDTSNPYTNLTLNPGERVKVSLPADIQMPTGTLTSNRAVRVVADDDVTVLSLNNEPFNSDMHQVKEAAMLGKEYTVVTPESFQSIYPRSAATVGIVSPYPDTKVNVILPTSFSTITATIDGVSQTLSREFSILLAQNQTFQIQSTSDLSGAYIVSDKPIAVISGVNRTATEQSTCIDGQITQLLSTDRLGTQYIAFGLKVSSVQDYIHVVTTQPNTSVTFERTTRKINQARGITRFKISRNQFKLVKTSAPAVVVMSTRSGNKGVTQGDPSMYSLQPLPLTGLQYTITIPDNTAFNSTYAHLVLMVASDGIDDILLDGVAITGATWTPVEGTNISACYYSVTDNTKTRVLRHRYGKPFAAYLQAYDYCKAYSLMFEPYQQDVKWLRTTQDQRRGGQKSGGKRMTSQRMKYLKVEFLNACFSFCLNYADCIGVNFSLSVSLGDINCHLLFTETNGQKDEAGWTFYDIVAN